MADGIEGAAMQLLRAANEHQAQGNTRAKIQPHWEAHNAGLVANSEGYDEAINSLVKAGVLEPLEGEPGAYQITQRGLQMLEEE
jgi:hypothetical protein